LASPLIPNTPAVSNADLPVLVHLLLRLLPGRADVRPAAAAVSQGLVHARLARFGPGAQPINIPYTDGRVTHGVGPDGLEPGLVAAAVKAVEEAAGDAAAASGASGAPAAGLVATHAAAAQAARAACDRRADGQVVQAPSRVDRAAAQQTAVGGQWWTEPLGPRYHERLGW
jgi:hypothetical protein